MPWLEGSAWVQKVVSSASESLPALGQSCYMSKSRTKNRRASGVPTRCQSSEKRQQTRVWLQIGVENLRGLDVPSWDQWNHSQRSKKRKEKSETTSEFWLSKDSYFPVVQCGSFSGAITIIPLATLPQVILYWKDLRPREVTLFSWL